MKIKYKKAEFIKFVGRRFKCLIKIDDKEELCYLASSSNLNHYLKFESNEILVTEMQSSSRGLKYRAIAIKIGIEWMIIDLHLVNRIVKDKLELDGYNIETEKNVDGYRADLVVNLVNKTLLYEVKSVLSLNEKVYFPMYASKRCEEQLLKLKTIASRSGYEVRYVFAILSNNIQEIEISVDELGYKELFLDCCNKGMKVECLRIVFENDEVFAKRINNVVTIEKESRV